MKEHNVSKYYVKPACPENISVLELGVSRLENTKMDVSDFCQFFGKFFGNSRSIEVIPERWGIFKIKN